MHVLPQRESLGTLEFSSGARTEMTQHLYLGLELRMWCEHVPWIQRLKILNWEHMQLPHTSTILLRK